MRATQSQPSTVTGPGPDRPVTAGRPGPRPADPGAGDAAAAGTRTRWERWNDASVEWLPYLLLAASTVIALFRPDRSPYERLITLGIVGAAIIWIYVGYTRIPRPRRASRGRMLVYVVGLLVLAAVLLTRNGMFFLFAIGAYFQLPQVRPWPVAVVAVFATSTLITTTLTGFPWPTADLWVLFGALIVVQTVTLGFGTVVGDRLSELSEQRSVLLQEREAALDENRGLQQQLVAQAREAGVLDERARMAREIHDTIAHGLTGVVTQLEAAEQAASADRPADWSRHVDNALKLARESLTEARRSVEASRPEALEGVSLEQALGDLAKRWSALNGIAASFTTTGDVLPLHPDIEVAILRTAQEALANVAKHAGATRAGLTLSYMGDVVTLDVRDDGVGFEVQPGGAVPRPTEMGSGFGLTAMRQRLGRLAGTLAIESEPGGGTAISARLPAIGP